MLTTLLYITLQTLDFSPEAARSIAITLNFWITIAVGIAVIAIALNTVRKARPAQISRPTASNALVTDDWYTRSAPHHDVPASHASYRDEPW